METQAWPMVKTVEELLALITRPITALLSEIASYVGFALDENYHLEQGVTYKSLSTWAKVMLHLSNNDTSSTAASTSLGDHRVPKKTSKVPSFALKPFIGDEFDGDDYMYLNPLLLSIHVGISSICSDFATKHTPQYKGHH